MTTNKDDLLSVFDEDNSEQEVETVDDVAIKLDRSLSKNISLLGVIYKAKEDAKDHDDSDPWYDPNRTAADYERDVEDHMLMSKDVKVNDNITLGYVKGYTGEEDGGSNVDFICRINDTFWRVNGVYDSWNGVELDWDDSTYLGKVREETVPVEYSRTQWIDESGDVVFFEDEAPKD